MYLYRYQQDNFADLAAFINAKRSPPETNTSDKAIFELVIVREEFNASDNPTLAEVLGKEIK